MQEGHAAREIFFGYWEAPFLPYCTEIDCRRPRRDFPLAIPENCAKVGNQRFFRNKLGKLNLNTLAGNRSAMMLMQSLHQRKNYLGIDFKSSIPAFSLRQLIFSQISPPPFQRRQQRAMGGSKVLISSLLMVLVFLTIFPVAGWARQQKPAATNTAPTGEYLLAPGDTIEVLVWEQKDMSRTLRIRIDGRITMPLIGEIEAAGKSTGELAAQIQKKYRHILTEPSVTVILSQSNAHYYVIGQVKQPGEFSLNAPLTVLQALARAGGFLEWAKTSHIELIRHWKGHEKLISFDYDKLKDGDLSQQIPLVPGDTIIVP